MNNYVIRDYFLCNRTPIGVDCDKACHNCKECDYYSCSCCDNKGSNLCDYCANTKEKDDK